MSDRELLENAAKAAGIEYQRTDDGEVLEYFGGGLQLAFDGGKWNPRTDDGDALRLAVKLEIELMFSPARCIVYAQTKHILGIGLDGEASYQAHEYFQEPYGSDKDAATRRAIVRAAAAEIGKAMP